MNATRPVLQTGDSGDQVRELQRLLGVTSDGIFGPDTKAAVVAFQTAHGLAADGIVGPLTWAALDGSAPPAPPPSGGGSSLTDRAALVAKLRFETAGSSQQSDLTNPAKTREHLVALLATIVSHGFTPLVTSVNTDHSPDNTPALGGLSNHGHTNGFAVDVFVDASQASSFIHDCIFHNPLVTKIGLGGEFQPKSVNGVGDHFSPAADDVVNNVVIFADNKTNHIHLQTA